MKKRPGSAHLKKILNRDKWMICGEIHITTITVVVSMNLSLIVVRITLLIKFNFKTLQHTFTKNRLQTVNIQTVLNNCDGH